MDMAVDVFRSHPRFDVLPNRAVLSVLIQEAMSRELYELASEVRWHTHAASFHHSRIRRFAAPPFFQTTRHSTSFPRPSVVRKTRLAYLPSPRLCVGVMTGFSSWRPWTWEGSRSTPASSTA